jgi:hypothetical protein
VSRIWNIVCLVIVLVVITSRSIGAVSPIASQGNSSAACSDVLAANSLNVEGVAASKGLQYSSHVYFSCFVSCDRICIERINDSYYELSVYDPIDNSWHSKGVTMHYSYGSSCICYDGVVIAQSWNSVGDEDYDLYVYDPVDHSWHSKGVTMHYSYGRSCTCCDGVVIAQSWNSVGDEDYDAYLYQITDHSWHSQSISCGRCECAPPPPQLTVNPCDSKDGWYDTSEIRWVTTNEYECKLDQKKEKEQIFQDWYCSDGFCIYGNGETRWIDTGETRTVSKSDGTDCGSDYYDDWFSYCKENEVWKHRLYHDFYCEGGSCTDHTSWVDDQLVEDCNSYDGWVDTGETRWVDDPEDLCREVEQKEQKYQDYYCDSGSCAYEVTDTQWVDTGNYRIKEFTLTINIEGTGSVTPLPGAHIYDCCSNVTITAEETEPDWEFSHWSGDASGTDPLIIIHMDSDKSVTAYFTLLSTEARVYLNPQDSSARFCETEDVEIWVNATEFQAGQMKLIYGSTCADVTNWVRNEDDFPIGTWDSDTPGEEWITFSALAPLTGDYLLGTLTIHCVCEEECTTVLEFVEDGTTGSALFNEMGSEIPTTWEDGTFDCTLRVCGDIAPYPDCDRIINMGDVVLLLNYVGHPGEHELCCEWCGDVAPCPVSDDIINMGDVVLLLNYVGHPGQYQLCCE